jgi:feruloyl esterase
MLTRLLAFAPVLMAATLVQTLFAQQPCERLAALKLPHTTILSAALVPEGPFSTADGSANALVVRVPARCVVQAVARPSLDSEIKFEVWLPAAGWNGKYQQAGNGGWAGRVPTQALIEPLRRGYAAAATDDGHDASRSPGATWAIGHPEKLVDFGYRAVHETGLQAKAIIQAFYGKDPVRSYFFGCSDGGREALMEAQRYAEDFDGIIAGAPANNWSHLFTGFVWNEQALLKEPGNTIPAAKLPAIQKAVLAACDSLDGLKDGLLEDPRACHFDPSVLACKGADSSECLTVPQVDALRKIYAGPRNPRTEAQIFPGYSPGAEAAPGNWAAWILPGSPQGPAQFAFGNSYYGQAVFEDSNWDFRKLNFDSDVAFADEKVGSILNSTSPDLRSLRAHGGKLIQYHGWGDSAIAPVSSIEYYEKVRSFLSKYPDARSDSSRPVQDFYRLFMVPGMGHCGGGAGPNSFGNGGRGGPPANVDADHDILSALERWVEKGVAPDKIIGTGLAAGDPAKLMTRPLCPYPQMARYNGTGDPNNAASFACAEPARSQAAAR